MGDFNFAQFRTMLNVIRHGEERDQLDTSGLFGSSESMKLSGSSKRIAGVAILAVLCVLLFLGGTSLAASDLSVTQVFFMMIAMVVVMVVIMGFYQAVNMLYFVKDMGFYLALPIPPFVIMAAKMTYFLATQVVVNCAILAFGLGFLAGRGADPLGFVGMVLAFIPCVIAVALALIIIVIPVMRFSRVAADKDRFARVFGLLTTAVSLVIAIGISLGSHNASSAVAAMSSVGSVVGSGVIAVILAVLCAPTLLVTQVFGGNMLLGLLGMYALAAVYVAVMGLFAKLWYFEGVRGMQGGAGKKSRKRYSEGELAGAVKQRSQFKAFLAQDMASLIRVPAFFQQFVVIMASMPLLILVVGGVGIFLKDGDGFGEMVGTMLAANIADGSHIMLMVVALGLALLSCFVSYMYYFSLGRDGEDFFFLRAMPMNMKSYVRSKFMSNFLIARVPVFVLLLIVLLVVGVPVDASLVATVAFALPVSAVDMIMFGIGSKNPKLKWENEAEFVKQSDSYMQMFIGLVLGAIAVIVPGAVMIGSTFVGIDPYIGVAALVVICIAEVAGAAVFAFGVAPKNMERVRP